MCLYLTSQCLFVIDEHASAGGNQACFRTVRTEGVSAYPLPSDPLQWGRDASPHTLLPQCVSSLSPTGPSKSKT